MQGGDPEGADQGQEDRRQQDDGRGGFHEHAGNQDDDGNEQHDDVLVLGNRQDRGGDGLRNAPLGQAPAEGAGAADDDHDDRTGPGGAEHDLIEAFGGQVAVDEGGNQNRIDHGHGSRLGRGEDAREDAAQDDEGHQDAGNGADKGAPDIGQGERGALGVVVSVGLEQGDHDEGAAHEKARDEAGLEQAVDALLGDDRVEDHGNGRGNDHPDGSGSGDEGRAGILPVASGLQLGHQGAADSGRGGSAGAGDGGKEHAGQNRDHGQAAPDHAQKGFAEFHQQLGNLALGEQVAGQNEEGNGDEGEGVAGFKHALDDHHQLVRRQSDGDGDRGGAADGEGHRHAYDQQNEKDRKENGGHYPFTSLPRACSRSMTRAWKDMMIMEMGRQE